MQKLTKIIIKEFLIKILTKNVVIIYLLIRYKKIAICNCCGWVGSKFNDFDCGFGRTYKNSTCPICQSQPRHRAHYFFLHRIMSIDKPISLLHFAPEKSISDFLKSKKNVDYLSVDLQPGSAMIVEDITKLTFKDNSFDIIVCMHVLEHIEDDNKAMQELFRVLRPGGVAFIDVPINMGRLTFEDKSIITPEDRNKYYWHWQHLRLYGKDYPVRLNKAGFSVNSVKFNPFKYKIHRIFGLSIDRYFISFKRN